MSVSSTKENNVEAEVVDGSVNIDAIGVFELERDLLLETDSCNVTSAGSAAPFVVFLSPLKLCSCAVS